MTDLPPLKTGYKTPIIRFYVDIRPAVPKARLGLVELPLLETLSQDQQDKVKAFMRPADRLMSLASALLKYVFIHRYALIPWDEDSEEQNQSYAAPLTGRSEDLAQGPPLPHVVYEQVRLGVDLACANEHGRTPADMTTQAKLNEWVDIFEEMFSGACRQDMKSAFIPNAASPVHMIQQRFRRFYAYWSLKEAYIKMVGEGLLADWLTKLEFQNVQAPEPPKEDEFPDDGFSWALRDEDELKWTPADRAIKNIAATLYGNRLHDVKLSLVAFETDFICATAMRGVQDATEGTPQERWIKLDIEQDIRPCAEGNCHCLDQKVVEIQAPLTATGSTSAAKGVPYTLVQADVPTPDRKPRRH